jgi:hypothetical protein
MEGGSMKSVLSEARRAWLAARGALRLSPRQHERIFEKIHAENVWGSPESRSGPGSTEAATAAFRDRIPRLLHDIDATSLLDAPCGDFNWMRLVELGPVRYIGVDVVADIIASNRRQHGNPSRRFLRLDVRHDRLPRADVILCRDCLVHMSFADIATTLRNFRRSGSAFFLLTTFIDRDSNVDIATGRWRTLNFARAPFNFPPPLKLIDEECELNCGIYRDKHLGLWRIEDLPE